MLRTESDRGRGFTLIELLIGITVGLIILAAAVAITVQTLKANTDNVRMARLEQDLRAVMMLMTREIRRGGYWENAVADADGDWTTAPTNQFIALTFTDSDSDGIADDNCLLFGYDLDKVGDVDDNEARGFRLKDNILWIKNAVAGTCADTNDANWQPLTDDTNVTISGLTINVVSTNVTVPSTAITVGGTDAQTVIRVVTLTLTGSLVSDATVSRSMTETVRIRANGYVAPT